MIFKVVLKRLGTLTPYYIQASSEEEIICAVKSAGFRAKIVTIMPEPHTTCYVFPSAGQWASIIRRDELWDIEEIEEEIGEDNYCHQLYSLQGGTKQMELVTIANNLIDEIMKGFNPQNAYKPAYDCEYIYAYVVQRLVVPHLPLITRKPMALTIDDDTVQYVNYTISNAIQKDPLAALGLATYLRNLTIPDNVSSQGKTVYWPDEYYYHKARIEVAKALADCIESDAREAINIPFNKGFIGVVQTAHSWQVHNIATVGDWCIDLEREPSKKDWKITVKKISDNKTTEREFPQEVSRRLPWGKPIIHTDIKIPASPFAVSAQGYIFNPKYLSRYSDYPVVAFEINIDLNGNVLIHAPAVLNSQFAHLSHSPYRIGDHYIESVEGIPASVFEIAYDQFTRKTSLLFTPQPKQIFCIYEDYYLVYHNSEEDIEILVEHCKKEHPSVKHTKKPHKPVKISRVPYIQAGHD